MASIDPSASQSLPTSVPTNPPSTTDSSLPVVNIGTLKSLVSRVRTDIVVAGLQNAHAHSIECRIHAISAVDDRDQLHAYDAKALWIYELEDMLGSGEIDLIVHSVDDIPIKLDPRFALGAIAERQDASDALVLHPQLPASTSLGDLPENATVGTSSVRRITQLKRLHPQLRFQSVRGQVKTRLRKLDESDISLSAAPEGSRGSKQGDASTAEEPDEAEVEDSSKPLGHYSALVVAAAELRQIDLDNRISSTLSSAKEDVSQRLLPAAGQGALGLQIRAGDERLEALLKPLNHLPTWYACLTERALVRDIDPGCAEHLGVETEWQADGQLLLRAVVVSLDGRRAVNHEATQKVESEKDAEELGAKVAAKLADLGVKGILEVVTLNGDVAEGKHQNGA